MTQKTKWQNRLDAIVSGEIEKPELVQIMRLPDLEAWAPGEVTTHWDVDPAFFGRRGQSVWRLYCQPCRSSFIACRLYGVGRCGIYPNHSPRRRILPSHQKGKVRYFGESNASGENPIALRSLLRARRATHGASDGDSADCAAKTPTARYSIDPVSPSR